MPSPVERRGSVARRDAGKGVHAHVQHRRRSEGSSPEIGSSNHKRRRLTIPDLTSDEDELTASPQVLASRSQPSVDRSRVKTSMTGKANSAPVPRASGKKALASDSTPLNKAAAPRKSPSTKATPLAAAKPSIKPSGQNPKEDVKPPVSAGSSTQRSNKTIYRISYLSKTANLVPCRACCLRQARVIQVGPRKTLQCPVYRAGSQGMIRAGEIILGRRSTGASRVAGQVRYWHFQCLQVAHLRQLKRDWGRAGKRLPAPEFFDGFEGLKTKDKHFVFQSIRQCKLVKPSELHEEKSTT